MKNPSVINYTGTAYAIRFVRRSGVVLTWVQDLTGRRMKNLERVTVPVVTFLTKGEAEKEMVDTVVPYLLEFKDVEPDEIVV